MRKARSSASTPTPRDANPGDTLTYSATNLPSGISINSSTGVVWGTLSATSSGSYAVVLTVSDGTLTDTDSFTWTVTEPAGPRCTRRTVRPHGRQQLGQRHHRWCLHPAEHRRQLRRHGHAGTISVPAAGNTRSAVLTTVSAQDIDLSFASPPTALRWRPPVRVRHRPSRERQAEYRVKVRLATTGQVFVQATSVSGGVETGLGTETLVRG